MKPSRLVIRSHPSFFFIFPTSCNICKREIWPRLKSTQSAMKSTNPRKFGAPIAHGNRLSTRPPRKPWNTYPLYVTQPLFVVDVWRLLNPNGFYFSTLTTSKLFANLNFLTTIPSKNEWRSGRRNVRQTTEKALDMFIGPHRYPQNFQGHACR